MRSSPSLVDGVWFIEKDYKSDKKQYDDERYSFLCPIQTKRVNTLLKEHRLAESIVPFSLISSSRLKHWNRVCNDVRSGSLLASSASVDFGKNQVFLPASANSMTCNFDASSYRGTQLGREMSSSDTSQWDAISLAWEGYQPHRAKRHRISRELTTIKAERQDCRNRNHLWRKSQRISGNLCRINMFSRFRSVHPRP